MKIVAFLLCFLGSSLSAPTPDSGSNEQAVIGHANTALQLMEFYRMLGHLQQQGFGTVASAPQQPAAPAPAAPAAVDAQPQVSHQGPQQGFFFNPAVMAHRGDGSDEEGETPFRFNSPYGNQPAQPAAPLNSDEAEEAEEAEAPEAAGPTEGPVAEVGAQPTEAAPAVDIAAANDLLPVEVPVDSPVAAIEPAADVIAAAVDPALVPQGPSVALEIDTTVVVPDIAAGAEQVLVAEDPNAAATV